MTIKDSKYHKKGLSSTEYALGMGVVSLGLILGYTSVVDEKMNILCLTTKKLAEISTIIDGSNTTYSCEGSNLVILNPSDPSEPIDGGGGDTTDTTTPATATTRYGFYSYNVLDWLSPVRSSTNDIYDGEKGYVEAQSPLYQTQHAEFFTKDSTFLDTCRIDAGGSICTTEFTSLPSISSTTSLTLDAFGVDMHYYGFPYTSCSLDVINQNQITVISNTSSGASSSSTTDFDIDANGGNVMLYVGQGNANLIPRNGTFRIADDAYISNSDPQGGTYTLIPDNARLNQETTVDIGFFDSNTIRINDTVSQTSNTSFICRYSEADGMDIIEAINQNTPKTLFEIDRYGQMQDAFFKRQVSFEEVDTDASGSIETDERDAADLNFYYAGNDTWYDALNEECNENSIYYNYSDIFLR